MTVVAMTPFTTNSSSTNTISPGGKLVLVRGAVVKNK